MDERFVISPLDQRRIPFTNSMTIDGGSETYSWGAVDILTDPEDLHVFIADSNVYLGTTAKGKPLRLVFHDVNSADNKVRIFLKLKKSSYCDAGEWVTANPQSTKELAESNPEIKMMVIKMGRFDRQ